jgi:membrane-associated protease RseP (regulator of RpoE activity)
MMGISRPLACALVLASCLPPRWAGAQEVPEAEIEAESVRLGEAIFEHLLAGTERVMRVGDAIRIAGAPYCGGQVGAVVGVFTLDKSTFPDLFARDYEFEKYLQGAAEKRYPLDQRERIFLVAPGSAGEKAGLRPGDSVTRVSGHSITRRDHLQALRVGEGETVVELGVERDGQELIVPVEVRLGCGYAAQAWFGNDINAFAGHMGRASGSYVLGGMLEFLPSDDDLALVLGHELGHLILYSGGTRRTEADADYVGLYVAARAGFDVSRANSLWQRMGEEIPLTNIAWGFYSHPSSAARSEALRATVSEITAKRADEKPLTPSPEDERPEAQRRAESGAAEDQGDSAIRAGALARLQEKRERLLRVSYRLRTGAVELCGNHTAPVLGASIGRRRDAVYGKEKDAEEIFGLVDEVKVLALLPDGPAAQAGVTLGDLVLAVDGADVKRTEDVFDSLRKSRERPPELSLSRAGAPKVLGLPLVLGCAEEFMLTMNGSTDIVPARNGDDLLVPEGLLRAANDDDELAFALAHSIAHDVLDTALLGSYSGEPAADVLALELVARAGFDASKAPDLLGRIVQEDPRKLARKKGDFNGLHGDMALRLLTVRRALAGRATTHAERGPAMSH